MTGKQQPDRRIALTKTQLSAASQTRQLLSALVRLASELNSTLDLTELLRTVLAKAAEVMEAQSCSLLLADPDGQALVNEASLAKSGEVLMRNCRLPLGVGIAGQVAETLTAYVNNRADNDRDICAAPDLPAGVRSILCVPLVAKNRLLGVARIANSRHAQGFSEDDMHLFRAFADIAAVSIANAQMHTTAIEHRKLEREMAVARDIQQGFLPASFPAIAGYEFEGFMEPASQVGGDYFDIFQTPAGQVCVAVADVSGKGASASLYMACLHSELHMAMDFIADPKAVLQRLNRIMHQRSQRGAFITLQLLLLDPRRQQVAVLSAGHPEPMLFDPATGTVSLVERHNSLPLGVMPEQDFEPTLVNLPQGSLLAAYTDGALEAHTPAGDEFGQERLQLAVGEAIRRGGPVLPLVLDRLRAFAGDAPQADDITMALLRRTQNK